MADDWFSANAPKAAQPSGDWFGSHSQPANQPPATPSTEPGFGQRMVAAVGPAVRGLGDIGVPFTDLDINHGLESAGLVAPGRLTGPEASDRDQATRSVSNLTGGSVVVGGILGRVAKSIQAAREAKLAAEAAQSAAKLDAANKATRAARTAKFVETGLIDASPEVIATAEKVLAAQPALTRAAVQEAAKLLIKAGLFGAGAKAVSKYLD